MHDFEDSEGVVATNIDTTIAATRIGSLRLTSDTDVASNQISLMASLETDACKLWRVLKDNKFVLFTIIRAQGCHSQIAVLFSSWHREPTVRGFLKTETAVLLQRPLPPTFPASVGRGQINRLSL